jgi:hypothetical protein
MISETAALRQVVLEALTETDRAQLKPKVGQLLCARNWDQFQLGEALRALACHLVGIDYRTPIPKQMPNGAALIEYAGHLPEFQVPDLSASAELGALWAVLGILQESSELSMASLRLANWHLNLLDSAGFPHLALWSKGGEFSVPRLLNSLYLHLLLCSRISGEEYFERAALLQKKHMKGWNRDELSEKLFELVAEKLSVKLRYRINPFAEEVTVGMGKWADREMSIACTLSGFNSGMGSFHKKEVAVVNFGPQMGALDDLNRFGIERPCSMAERTFADLKWEKGAGGVSIQGWTKVFGDNLWMFSTLGMGSKQLRIALEFQEDKPRASLSFVFYLKGQKCVIGGREHVQAYSLDRYQGNAASVVLSGETEKIYIDPGPLGSMTLIPLAGGDFFWGSDFLLVFEIDPKIENVSWVIK